MNRSGSVPSLVIVERGKRAHSKTLDWAKRTASNISKANFYTNRRSLKRVVSDISMSLLDQDEQSEPDAPRCYEEAGNGSIRRQSAEQAQRASFPKRVSVPQYSQQIGFRERMREKGSFSSWFLPLGRPLAAAPTLPSATPGTAVNRQGSSVSGKRRRRSPRRDERGSRRKVSASPLLEDEHVVIDAAVTLSRLGSESQYQPVSGVSSFRSALPPPPFQLLGTTANSYLSHE